jgi:TolB-like protein/DNA-binding winged helix-turn-helix (wHTH) protein/Flp pilus assembly protein TadD
LNPSCVLPRVARFDVFEVDLRSGELRTQGSKIRLQDKPLQILRLLLEHPGDVVSREELQKRLWPDGVIVDFEHSINTAVKRLREALDDDPEHPRYIETLPRHGYRFIAPVEAPTPPARAVHRLRLLTPWVIGLAGIILALGVLTGFNIAGLRQRLVMAVRAVREPPPQIRSIAVLPLENLSQDPGQEYLADGMTEELITYLAKISSLKVISRTSMMQYKGTKKPLPQIAKELDVDAAVEGSVSRSGNRVRVTANLLHAATDRHLWANTYESDMRDVLALQGEVARAIAEEVKVKLTPEDQGRLTITRRVVPDAYQLYLKGRRLSASDVGRDSFLKAIRYLEEAIQKDPEYAPIHARLAGCYDFLSFNEHLPVRETQRKARALVMKALELDSNLAEAHTALGEEKIAADWDWSGGLAELRRGTELDPGDAEALYHYGWGLWLVGRFDEAIPVLEHAVELDPVSYANFFLAGALFDAHQDERAIQQYQKMLRLELYSSNVHSQLGLVYEAMGRYDEAVSEYLKTAELNGTSPVKVRARHDAYKIGGIQAFWRKTLQDVMEKAKPSGLSPATYAKFSVHAGNNEEALRWLAEAYQQHTPSMVGLKSDRVWDPLRSDPRFQDLLRRMNFPP